MSHSKKRRRSEKIDLANPPAVNPESVMVVTRGKARETVAEQVVAQRMTEIMAFQLDVPEGYTPDPELAEVVKRLLITARWSPQLRRVNCGRRGPERR